MQGSSGTIERVFATVPRRLLALAASACVVALGAALDGAVGADARVAQTTSTDLPAATHDSNAEGNDAPLGEDGRNGEPGPAMRQPTRARELFFEPNVGQSDSRVRFIGRAAGYTVFLTDTDALLDLRAPAASDRAAWLRVRPVAANPAPVLTAAQPLAGRVNYVQGSEAAPGLSRIATFGSVRYHAVYPGIDLVYYGNHGRLEYDFIVAPGADANVVTLEFEGAARSTIDAQGTLVLETRAGELRQPAPTVYQVRDGVREPVAAAWRKTGAHRVAIRLGRYDRERELVIDPLLQSSTYFGGSGDDSINSIALDAQGNIYAAGFTSSPELPGAPTRAGSETIGFVSKIGADGTMRYTTYLLDTDERGAMGVALDTAGSAYVTGRVSLWSQTAWNDAFVAKLDASGSVQAPAGYYFTFGGDNVDWGQRIAVDATGQAVVAGVTLGGSFPTTEGAWQRSPAGDLDGFVVKVNAAGTQLIHATLIGGSALDSANAIALDAAGNAYIAGSTESPDFPVTANAFQREHRSCSTSNGITLCSKAAFVAKLDPSGNTLAYATFLGGTDSFAASVATALAVDSAGHAYVTGATTATDFPTTRGVVQPEPGERLCFREVCSDAFVTKLNPTGSGLVYSTYLFGESQDEGVAIAVDTDGSAVIAGSTVSRYFPAVDAFQPRPGAFEDAFVAKLNADATRFAYASYLGGTVVADNATRATSASAIAIDSTGRVLVAGQTFTSDFPTTPGALQPAAGGGVDCGWGVFACGDAFLTRVGPDGPGRAPAMQVRVATAAPAAGRRIEASWSGIDSANANDRIRLYALGSSQEHDSAWGGWATDGTAAGSVGFDLPSDLRSGWYEIRLWSGDPAVLTPLARSAPFRVTSVFDLPSGGGPGGGTAEPGGAIASPYGGGASSGWFLVLLALALAALRPSARLVGRS